MGISGYMIACIVVVIFVAVAIAVLVYVIHWRRKKRKERTIDVPTQSSRSPGEQTKPNGGNANSNDIIGPRLKPTAPPIDIRRANRQRPINHLNDENNSQSGYVIYNAEPNRSRNNNDRSSANGDRFSSSSPRLSPDARGYVPRYRENPRDWHPNSDIDSRPPPPYAEVAVESNGGNHDHDEYEIGRNRGFEPMDEYETGSNNGYAAYTENEMTNYRGYGVYREYGKGSNRGDASYNESDMINNHDFGVHNEYERGGNNGYAADKQYEMGTHHVHDPYRISSPSRTYYNDPQGQQRSISSTAV